MSLSLPALLVAVLATWRVTHLLQAEDGPGDVIVRLRRAAGAGFFGSLLDCFYCLSLWVAAPFALLAGSGWLDRGMLWLALSGGACLLERLQPSPLAPLAPIFIEDKEESDGLLRQQTSAGIPAGGPASESGPAEPAAAIDGGDGGERGDGSGGEGPSGSGL
jgi:hypothetical protein